jgi:CheY-like chemotaxis protein
MILAGCQDWHIICEALDGLDAVQKSGELQPDSILLEVGLPRLNGIEAARQSERSRQIRKLHFSATTMGRNWCERP